MKFIFFSFPHRFISKKTEFILTKGLEHNPADNCFLIASQTGINSVKKVKHFLPPSKCKNIINSTKNKYVIDENIFPHFDSSKQRKIDFFETIACKNHPSLIEKLEECFESILKESKIDAIFTMRNCASISYIAKKYNLPLIHLEGGPLRPPQYMRTGYFDFSGLYGNNECLQRYEKFKKEISENNNSIVFFEREELFKFAKQKSQHESLYLHERMKYRIRRLERKVRRIIKTCAYSLLFSRNPKKQFDAGVALQMEEDLDVVCNGGEFNNFQAVAHTKSFFDDDKIIIRKHPVDLSKEIESEVNHIDKSNKATAFIKKCDRIVVLNSALAYESLLLGKPTWVLGSSPIRLCSSKSNDLDNYQEPDDFIERLNYFLFGYSAPWDLMTRPEYVKFRLSNPTEIEIYKKHLDYWNSVN